MINIIPAHNEGPEHYCPDCGPQAKEATPTLPTKLLVIADDYLKAVCELAVRANDSTSRARMEQLERALKFAHEVTKNGLSF